MLLREDLPDLCVAGVFGVLPSLSILLLALCGLKLLSRRLGVQEDVMPWKTLGTLCKRPQRPLLDSSSSKICSLLFVTGSNPAALFLCSTLISARTSCMMLFMLSDRAMLPTELARERQERGVWLRGLMLEARRLAH